MARVKIYSIVITATLGFPLVILAQPQTSPAIEWQKTFGGSGLDDANSIQQTNEGGYIVAGYNMSNDGDVTGNHGQADYWIVKLTSTGVIEWQKSLGGSDTDEARSIQQTNDSGFIVAGHSKSTDGDVTGNHGNYDYWVVKLTKAGAIEWEKSLGGSGDDEARSIQQTSDSGFIVAGYSNSTDGDVTGNHGSYDYWVVKLTRAGAIEWEKSLGGSGDEEAYCIRQTNDGGFIVSGYSYSSDGDVTGNHGGQDYWVVKLTSTGAIEWEKSLGGTGDDWSTGIQQTSDSGFVVGGKTTSHDGDVTENHGAWDFWIVKLTSTGAIQWQKSTGGSDWDRAEAVQQTRDGGYIMPGYSLSNDDDVTGHHGSAGSSDCWVVKLTREGNLQWEKSLGGSNNDYENSAQQTSDGGYILAGVTSSTDGDVTLNHGYYDFWIVKLAPEASGVASDSKSFLLEAYPNPFQSSTCIMALGTHRVTVVNTLGIPIVSLAESSPGEFLWMPNPALPSGLYFARSHTSSGSATIPVMLTR